MKLEVFYDFRKKNELDRSFFNVRVGDHWFNNEEQKYTDAPDTHFFTEEGLVIQAIEKDGVIESARIDTEDRFSFLYGRIEFVASFPGGLGTWPALWLLPQGNPYGPWPRSGEIDVVEHIGRRPNVLYYSLHTELYNWKKKDFYTYEHEEKRIINHFHKYVVEWYPNRIVYELDDKEVVTFYKGDQKRDVSAKGWPFDKPFFILMNLAMGGNLGGPIDRSALPQQMIIQSLKVSTLEEDDV